MGPSHRPRCHVLNFFHDSDSASALTVLVNDVRFHIIADPRRLAAAPLETYNKLLTDVKLEEGAKDEQSQEGDSSDRNKHNAHGDEDEDEDDAASTSDQSTQDSGVAVDSQKSEADAHDDADSAVDLSVDAKEKEHKPTKKDSHGVVVAEAKVSEYTSAEKILQNWLVSSLGEQIQRHTADKQSRSKNSDSIWQWYNRDTHFYELQMQNDEVVATEIDATDDLKHRITDTIPKLPLPKYLRNTDIPWLSPDDIQVLSESNEPEPVHPAIVKYKDTQYFFKAVDPTQPQPTKREIKILQKISSSDLHWKIHCPQIHGLVSYSDSQIEVMGYILTNIPDATPLTMLLDTDVPQSKRDEWAKKSGEIKKILHKNKIVWGDAKADNFMVDKDDNLWIIDFGGSYTDGWVDPELMETKAGDNMGVEKIVNALKDPVGGTYDPNDLEGQNSETQSQDHEDETTHADATKKRKREEDDDEGGTTSDQETDRYVRRPRKRAAKQS